MGLSKCFEVNSGVLRQGCKLSPLLFVIYMDKLVKDCKFVSDVKVKDYSLSSLLYADDLVLISRNAKGLQHNLERLSRACDEFGMKINLEKTKTMVISRKQKFVNYLVEGRIPDKYQILTTLELLLMNLVD